MQKKNKKDNEYGNRMNAQKKRRKDCIERNWST